MGRCGPGRGARRSSGDGPHRGLALWPDSQAACVAEDAWHLQGDFSREASGLTSSRLKSLPQVLDALHGEAMVRFETVITPGEGLILLG